MNYIVVNDVLVTQLGTRVPVNGDLRRAEAEAARLDKLKTEGATSRAQNAGHNQPLSAEEIRSGSWRNSTQSVRVRIAIEAADRAFRSGDHERAALLLRQHATASRALHRSSNFSDQQCEADAKLLESLAGDYLERGRFLAEVRPAAEPEAPQVPAWIEKHKQAIRDDFNLTEEQKTRRLRAFDQIEQREKAKIGAEAERKAKFDRSEYTGALADATASVGLAELSRDLPEEFVIGTRERLANLQATGDDVTYWAETTVAESKAKAFRELKKSEREAQAKAEREAAKPETPAPTGVTLAVPAT